MKLVPGEIIKPLEPIVL